MSCVICLLFACLAGCSSSNLPSVTEEQSLETFYLAYGVVAAASFTVGDTHPAPTIPFSPMTGVTFDPATRTYTLSRFPLPSGLPANTGGYTEISGTAVSKVIDTYHGNIACNFTLEGEDPVRKLSCTGTITSTPEVWEIDITIMANGKKFPYSKSVTYSVH